MKRSKIFLAVIEKDTFRYTGNVADSTEISLLELEKVVTFQEPIQLIMVVSGEWEVSAEFQFIQMFLSFCI